MNRLFVDVHVLQTVPPSCINRDDTGSPKTAVYGGVTRARVSSQSWKKAVRDMFKDGLISKEKLGERTKQIVSIVAEEIKQLNSAIDASKAAQNILDTLKIKTKSAEKDPSKIEMAALFFMSSAQAKALAKLAVEDPKADKKTLEQALKDNPSVDIALFGRMVADDPILNTDACAQVAHAISTHIVNNEYDYFTAVDDRAPEDNAGAGHIGTVEYNSSTLYRYATVAVHDLRDQLGDYTAEAVVKFAEAFMCAMPTGKQNSFANRTVPDGALITVRVDQPVNLVGAFEKPIRAFDKGYVDKSAEELKKHAEKIYHDWLDKPAATFVVGLDLSDSAKPRPMKEALAALLEEIAKRLKGGE